MTLACSLEDGFNLALLHGFADFPVDDGPAIAVENAAQEVESAGNVEVADIDVPVLVRLEGLHEASAFFAGGAPLDLARRPA